MIIGTEKRSTREWIGLFVAIAAVLGGTVVGFTTQNALLTYLLVLIGIFVYAVAFAPRLKLSFLANASWFDYLTYGVFGLSYVIAPYFLIIGELQPSNILLLLGSLSMALSMLNKASQTSASVRKFFLGYTVFYLGVCGYFANQLIFFDTTMRVIIIVAGAALALVGLSIAQQNRKAANDYWRTQRQQKQMDRGLIGPLYDEQLKQDKVKEQR